MKLNVASVVFALVCWCALVLAFLKVQEVDAEELSAVFHYDEDHKLKVVTAERNPKVLARCKWKVVTESANCTGDWIVTTVPDKKRSYYNLKFRKDGESILCFNFKPFGWALPNKIGRCARTILD